MARRHSPESSSARSESGATYASLAIPAYRTLFTAGLISFISVQGQAIGRGWLANELSDSNAGLGGVFMAFGIPMLLTTPLGGVAADRYSKKKILIITQLMMVVSAAWVGFGVSFGFIEYWMLLAASLIQGVAFSFLGPARMAMTGELVGRDLLTNAIVLGQMSNNLSRVVGPAMAGVFIGVAWIGIAGVYHVGAILAVLSAIAIITLPKVPSVERSTATVTEQFSESLRYVWQRRRIGNMLVLSFLVVMVGFPFLAFLPRYTSEILDRGAGMYGVMSAVSAVGAVASSMYVAKFGNGRRIWKIQIVAGVAFGVVLILLGVAPGLPAALMAIFLIGAASAAFQAVNNSLVLALSDLEYHGRVQSLMMLSFSALGIAALPLGVLADVFGIRQILVTMGFGVLGIMGWYALASRNLRSRRRPVLA